jgi:hypothetical protein
MTEKSLEFWIEKLCERALPDGGFSGKIGGGYRSDATAWAAFALAALGARGDLVRAARSRLSADQMEDGRISISPDHPQAFWPTPLAILAWHGPPKHRDSQLRALKFLLTTTGIHFEKNENSVVGHDTLIKGWPWIGDTHSWVEPTSMVLLALELTGHNEHDRAREARRMLLDRQLEEGGWNYGNATVFGRQLRPMPESTGLALNALAGKVPDGVVGKSLLYLKDQINRLRTPLSLGWSLLGLGAWKERPVNADNLIHQCLANQNYYGVYNTHQLSLLLASLQGKRGLLSLSASPKAAQSTG